MENSYEPLESNRGTLELSCRARFWNVLNNMSKCRALMDKTKANRFLHISPCLCAAGTTLPRGRSQEGNQKLKTQLIHIWLVSLWRRDLSTPVLWNRNSTYYRYLHTLHYITLHCIALRCIAWHYITYIHACIHTYVRFFLFLRGGSKKYNAQSI